MAAGAVVVSGAAAVSGVVVVSGTVVVSFDAVVVSGDVVVSSARADVPSLTSVGVVVPSACANIVKSPVEDNKRVAVNSIAINLNVICLFTGLPPGI